MTRMYSYYKKVLIMKKRVQNKYHFFFMLVFSISVNVHSEDEMHSQTDMKESHMEHLLHKASHHAPIGIMGGEYHKKGEFMFSINRKRVSMKDNSSNGKQLSDYEIISLPNPYNIGAMPSKLSVVPENMDVNMTMLGGMYGISDRYTLMVMAMYVEKKMNMNTYSAMANRSFLGSFRSQTSDLSNFSLSSLIKIKETQAYKLHAEIGLEKSIGDSDKQGEVLNPMNMKMNIRFPYSMQTGDKSTSLISAMTFVKKNVGWGYGSQIRHKQAINKKEWNFGNSLTVNIWVSKDISDQLSWSLRGTFIDQAPIEGRDIIIMAPVQTSNPANYGGQTYEIALGMNRLISFGNGNRIGLELVIPVKQNLNGPQMERSHSINLAYQKSF